jgi:hypothetical protein
VRPIRIVVTGVGAAGAAIIIAIGELTLAPATAMDDASAIPKPKPCEKDKEHCRKVLEDCRERCWDDDKRVPKGRGQDTFLLLRRCVRECMLAQGCENY